MNQEFDFNEFILASMPTFIAINYQRLLETQDSQQQVELILHIYNLGLRALTINLVSQYIFRDRALKQVSDPYLDTLLEQKFPHLTADAWEEMLFTTLRAYEGHRDLFFMPQLYDFYWGTPTSHESGRAEVKPPFDRLTQATLEQQTHRLLPQDASGWQTLAAELLGHLRKILESLSFIGEYDLIHVLTQDERSYTFELHKGTRIFTQQRPLPQPIRMTTGWFYLRANTEEFLPLHPLLVFWEDTTELTDTGVFDRRIQERLKYLLATPGQIRFDEKRVRDFVKLIYLTIQEASAEKERAAKLTWVQLCDLCEKISVQYMATVRGKYHQELYLQRDTAHQHMEAFLADLKKRGFVLVGKSGVGKSNFLLALVEELHQSRDDVCVLMYDGANLPIASSSLTQIISQDFSNQGVLFRQPGDPIWREIAQIGGIDERLIIVCVDAINENAQATELLRQLNALVQSPWPWLKVVLSSRPETWKEIKRGVKLAEVHYYQEPGTASVGIELEPFSYSEQMEPFTPQELPKVYSNYQREFHLQTPYEALTHQVRETLRDPLNLWLLASSYKGQAIPDRVKTSKLIEYYLKTRQVQTLLQREDVRFLEDRLVSLMVREEHYSNVITETELDAAGGALYDMIYSNQVLSDGRHMNQSFLRLCDVDVLVLHEQGTEQGIAFKYERFYEYFVGKRIASLSETRTDRYAFFQASVEETTHTPFLWGAVRNALVEEAKKPNSETILQLCRTTKQREKEMMVDVLITLGLDDPEPVEGILRNLVPQEKRATELQKIRQVLVKSAEDSPPSRNARKIAIEVASNLGISWVLQAAALQADPTIRAVAVRYTFHLWQRDQEKGFQILEYLAQNAIHGLIPNSTAFESTIGLSAIIFFEHFNDETVRGRLQSIWREVIAKILHIREESSRLGETFRRFIREQLLSFVITIIFQLFRQFPSYNFMNEQGFEAFFHLDATQKALYKRVVHYMDVEGNYSREQMEHDYLEVLKTNNLLLVSVEHTSLVAQACHAPLAFLPFLKQLFEEAKKDVISYPHLSYVANSVSSVLDRDPMIDEVFDFMVYVIEVSQEVYAKYPQTLPGSPCKAPEVFDLAAYTYHQHRRAEILRIDWRTDWFKTRIQKALSENNSAYFEELLNRELSVVAIDSRRPDIALDALELFFERVMKAPAGNEIAEIRKLIQSFLARLRIMYPDEVEDFLEEQDVPEEFRLQVRTNEPDETVGALIGLRTWFFLRDSVLVGSPQLRSLFIHLLEKAADCKNVHEWIEYFIRHAINVIYGGEAFREST